MRAKVGNMQMSADEVTTYFPFQRTRETLMDDDKRFEGEDR
jgi:hypothetical protein